MAAKHRRKDKQPKAPPRRPVRSFWSGTISFGLVNVPIHLFPANRRVSVSLRMLDDDGTPLSRRYYCPQHNVDVHPEHILRGYQLENEEYVIVRDEELRAIEPKKTREIDLRRFVDLAEISPMYFDRAYYLTPAGDSNKAYRLLAAVMEETGRAGIATFVMRDREYLIAILAENGILRAQTLRFEDELRTPEDVGLPEAAQGGREEVSRLTQWIKRHTADALDTDILQDKYAAAVKHLAEEKRKQKQNVVRLRETAPDEPEDADDEGPDIDLLETIRRSLQQGGGLAPNGNGKRESPPGNQPARSELASRSKEDLYERARQLKIPGRSKLSKEELVLAVSRAEAR